MGHSKHFIGLQKGTRVRDLFPGTGEPSSIASTEHPEGSIVEVRDGNMEIVAEADSAEAALYAIAASRGLDPIFPVAVEDEVRALVATPGIDDPELVDHTDWPFVTIDGENSMDLDQAVYIEPVGEGHIVHYALADASHFVVPGTALHAEALRRGASYYFPGFMVPMLPRALSEDLVSLNADVERRALLISSHLDAEGVCTHSELSRVRIRSRGKLSFGGVQAFYDAGDSPDNEGFGDAVNTNLRHLATVGKRRMSLAEERGVVRYRRVTASTDLGKGGLRFTAIREVRLEVERYNEQLSLLCNIEGARLLSEFGDTFVEPVYRAHPAPSEVKMRTFEKVLAALVKYHELPDTWLWTRQSETALRDYLDALPHEGKEGRVASAIHRQAVMSNVRSMFQTEAAGHHGVGADVYARFSAPMREMVGVFLHRELFQGMAGAGHADEELRSKIVVGANEAKSVQRAIVNESNRLVLDQIFEDALANETKLPAVLMGAARSKAYVRLESPPIDAKVYLGRGDDVLRPSNEGAGLSNATQGFGLGDSVTLTVLGRDERDRWELEIL